MVAYGDLQTVMGCAVEGQLEVSLHEAAVL